MPGKGTKKEAFFDINTIDEFMNAIENSHENMKSLYDNYFYDDNLILAIMCVNSMKNDELKEKEFIKYMHFVDKKLNFPGEAQQNRRHKIPTIFAGAIYIDKFNKEFNIYTDQEKMIISKYSAFEPLDFYENVNHYFGKRVMDAVVSKNKNWGFQDDFLKIVRKYVDLKSEDEIIDYLNEHDEGELIRECFRDFQELLEKMGAYI